MRRPASRGQPAPRPGRDEWVGEHYGSRSALADKSRMSLVRVGTPKIAVRGAGFAAPTRATRHALNAGGGAEAPRILLSGRFASCVPNPGGRASRG